MVSHFCFSILCLFFFAFWQDQSNYEPAPAAAAAGGHRNEAEDRDQRAASHVAIQLCCPRDDGRDAVTGQSINHSIDQSTTRAPTTARSELKSRCPVRLFPRAPSSMAINYQGRRSVYKSLLLAWPKEKAGRQVASGFVSRFNRPKSKRLIPCPGQHQ